jgi:iron complex outermembrane receptor protein/hemoglobin/transferrin/lactoferrin receptor protein
VRQVQLTGSYQRFLEGRRSRRNDAPTFADERDDTGTWGSTLTVHSEPVRGWHAQSGAELYLDRVGSTRRDVTVATGDFTPQRGLYPDGSRAASLAVYSLHSLTWRKFTLTAGGRYNAYRITVPENTLGETTLRPAALVGNAGVSYALHPLHRLTASVQSAFRAPNVDDLGTLGIVDFRYELPNAGLSPEKALGYELGWKVRTDRFSASVAAYYNGLSNIIGRGRAGNDSVQGYPVYLKENVAKAFIRGLEAEAEVQLARHLSAYGGLTYTYGQNRTAREPFRRIPPLNGRAGLSYGHGRPGWVRAETLFAGRQDRLAGGDIDDNRIGPGGTPGWWIVSVNGGYAYRWLGVSAELHNLLDRPYKTHGSGVYGPGRSIWLTVTVALGKG